MISMENPSHETRRLRTWPFRQHRAVFSNSTNGNTDYKISLHSELDSGYHQSFRSIFMTDSSKTIDVNERNISQNSAPTTISMSTGNIITRTFGKRSSETDNRFECPICCNKIQSNKLKQMSCCSMVLCSSCLLTHTITSINNGKAKIECPSCSADLNSSTILYSNELPVSIRERYQQILAQDLAEKQHSFIKLCPHCSFITILNANDPIVHGKKSRQASQEWICCEQCNKEWCWPCYAPSHPNETCRQFKKRHFQLDTWAKTRRTDRNNQRNAQRCPKCSIYIEKVNGCDHMRCTKCNSQFCYRCGSRMRLPFCVGHDAKYSIFGCKYKLWPDRPLLRWLTRSSIFAGVLLLTPVALSALIALVAVGIPTVLIIGCFALPVLACLKCKKRS